MEYYWFFVVRSCLMHFVYLLMQRFNLRIPVAGNTYFVWANGVSEFVIPVDVMKFWRKCEICAEKFFKVSLTDVFAHVIFLEVFILDV